MDEFRQVGKIKRCAGCRKPVCDGCAIAGVMPETSKNRSFCFPPGFQADSGRTGYGIAFDIGTTTVAGLLFDLQNGNLLQTAVKANPQAAYGRDVVSRISYALESEENLFSLQKMIVTCMNGMIEDLLGTAQCEAITVVGNPTMCHLFLGISPIGLARAPFAPAFQGIQRRKGHELGFVRGAECEICILPGIAGHVGADMMAVYEYVRQLICENNKDSEMNQNNINEDRKNESRKNEVTRKDQDYLLIIDLGTNGEIIAMGKEKILTCSAAAGPALEGAAVYQGMQGMAGAIEGVRAAGEELQLDVIGDAHPAGICGSGLIDTLAVLLDIGVMDETGYLISEQEGKDAGIRQACTGRLTKREGQNAFVLSEEGQGVILTAGDIRQLQLAKGAIRAGIEVLLKHLCIEADQLQTIYLAGAFGNYIRKESAIRIGLLPEIEPEKIVTIGNGAGIGAGMALLSPEFLAGMEWHAQQITHIELAGERNFQELFMNHLNF